MDHRVLHAFCEIAEHGSLTKAAVLLGDTQSALSRRISGLEIELGGRLFYRTGRGMYLTDLGKRILPRARVILAEARALKSDALGERDNPTATVELGVVPAMSRPFVSMLCARLRKQYPGIHLRALEGYSGQIEEWLAGGRIDLGMFNSYGRGTVPGAELLLQSSIALVAPRGLSPDDGEEISFQALRDLPLALPPKPNALVAALSDTAARQRFALHIAFEATSGALIRDAVEHAGLCTLAPLHFVRREYTGAKFTIQRVVRPCLPQKSWLVLSTQRPVSHAARIVAHLMREIATEAKEQLARGLQHD